MFGYRVPAPNQAMLISGGRQRGRDDATQFRIVTGHGAFVLPVFRKVSFLTLAMQEAEVIEDTFTQQGLTLNVSAIIAFKVGDDMASISAAARRFLADQRQMSNLVGRIFSGHLRSIVGSMTVESIIRDQQRLGEAILDASKGEMARIGLLVDSLQISEINDKGSGYIAALAAPYQAAINRESQIAQAKAIQASAEAQQASERAQAEFRRQTAIARADYQAQIDTAEARSQQAGPLSAAQAQQDVLIEQAKVAERNADLRQAQLVAEVVKPAEAEAERIRTLAKAEADRTRMSAEAAASADRIALDQRIIDQLPQMIAAAASGLANANVTVLNGAEGLNSTVASMAAQGLTILDTLTSSLRDREGGSSSRPAIDRGSSGADAGSPNGAGSP
ncbi:MAG TPA: SPFH domain-containing protein [Frankiaceae bacterium]|nr:SPFH domain-containing protein [Frankiaceae bacterium]